MKVMAVPKQIPKKEVPKQSKAELEQELQKKYIELQMLKQHLNTIAQQKQMIDERLGELNITMGALKSMSGIKKGEEIWSSLGSGAFIKSDIKDTSSVLVAVGAGVVIQESIPKAAVILESRLKDMEAVSQDVMQQAQAYMDRINKLEPEVEKLAEALG